MTLKIYHLKTCDTCRKAIKVLKAAGHSTELTDVRADGLDTDFVNQLISDHGWEAVLNRRSTTWRGLTDADKTDVTDAKAAALILQHPTLLKRPVIMSDNKTTIGWKPDVQAVWL